MLLPIYLILLAAFASRAAIFDYPRPLLPVSVSLESMAFFLASHGVLPALGRSLIVGALTVALSLVLGCPAGYAIARYPFRGRNLLQLMLVNVRAFPLNQDQGGGDGLGRVDGPAPLDEVEGGHGWPVFAMQCHNPLKDQWILAHKRLVVPQRILPQRGCSLRATR